MNTRIVDEGVVTEYLLRLGYENFLKPEQNRWEVTLCNSDYEPEEFTVEIYLRGPLIGFVSSFFENLEGDRLAEFYELIHRLNYHLDLFKFGISEDGQSITLQVEWGRAYMDYKLFKEILDYFPNIYAKWWLPLVETAHKMGLTKREEQVSWLDNIVHKFLASGRR